MLLLALLKQINSYSQDFYEISYIGCHGFALTSFLSQEPVLQCQVDIVNGHFL